MPLKKRKVIIGMSGGVDSSVAAYLLKAQGYEVEGVTLILIETRGKTHPRACCSIEAVKEAQETAYFLGIPHKTIEARDKFIDKVIEPFINGYIKGITPNPCILCNLHIKFPFLLSVADSIDAEFIATGHYARVEYSDNNYFLKKGIDPLKDQSYFLYVLKKNTLERIIFPLGQFFKEQVKNIAKKIKLPALRRPESVEICFVGDNYTKFIKNIVPEAVKSGPIIGPDGKIIGRHKGIINFTIGQRKGLGISYGKPLYVTKIEPESNTIYLDTRNKLYKKIVEVEHVNWLTKTYKNVTAKLRSTMKDVPATLNILNDNKVILNFDEPQWAPAAGQSAVFYKGDIVIGGGIIR